MSASSSTSSSSSPSSCPPSASSSPSGPDPLSAFGWDGGFADHFAPYAAEGATPARVVRVYRGLCDAVIAEGGGTRVVQADTAAVATRDPMRVVCTGDWIALDRAALAVRAVLPRRTAFVRSTSSKRSEGQVLAANVDQAVVAMSLAGDIDFGRMERFLALAWESGAQPLLVLTKADLASDTHHLLADAEAAAPGVQVLAVSARTGEGMDVLAALLAGGTAVLVGQSGAGKSTLANALLGAEVQTVNHIRDRDGKGRHTTVSRDLLPLPSGGVLIDTPGLRGVGMWDAATGVQQVFSEIEELARNCRFHDCSHGSEPDCAVQGAIADGELQERRLESYRKLQRENEWIAARTDARLAAERRRRWKAVHKSVRDAGVIRRR